MIPSQSQNTHISVLRLSLPQLRYIYLNGLPGSCVVIHSVCANCVFPVLSKKINSVDNNQGCILFHRS